MEHLLSVFQLTCRTKADITDEIHTQTM